MQITQPARAQFRSFRAETTEEIRPKPKLATVLFIKTETTPKLSFLPVSAPIPKTEPKFGRPLMLHYVGPRGMSDYRHRLCMVAEYHEATNSNDSSVLCALFCSAELLKQQTILHRCRAAFRVAPVAFHQYRASHQTHPAQRCIFYATMNERSSSGPRLLG